MAIAIMGGLLVATQLTRVFLLAEYVALFGNEKSVSPMVTAKPV